MYLIRPSDNGGYFVDQKYDGVLVDSFYVQLTPRKSCSCKYFTESNNHYNHFHISLIEYWLKQGSPKSAMYEKDKNGKIKVLFEGIKI